MCDRCLPVVEELAVRLLEENASLRELFPDPDLLKEDESDGDDMACTELRVRCIGGDWEILTGSPQFDTDHRGVWASGWLYWEELSPDEALEMAEELREELAEDMVQADPTYCRFHARSA